MWHNCSPASNLWGVSAQRMTPESRNAPGDGGARSRGESLSLHSYDFSDVELIFMAPGREGKSLKCHCSHLCQVRGIPGGTSNVEPLSQELQRGAEWGRLEGLCQVHSQAPCE